MWINLTFQGETLVDQKGFIGQAQLKKVSRYIVLSSGIRANQRSELGAAADRSPRHRFPSVKSWLGRSR